MYQIRNATIVDMLDLLRMHETLMNHIYYRNPNVWKLSKDREKRQKYFYDKIINNPSGKVYIAISKSTGLAMGMICGWAIPNDIFCHPTFGRIEDLWVDPEYRRSGIGSELLFSILIFFESKNINELSVNYASGNKEAEAFWVKVGFKEAIITSNASVLNLLQKR